MLETSIAALDWLGIVAFTITGALVASRNQMDVVGFIPRHGETNDGDR